MHPEIRPNATETSRMSINKRHGDGVWTLPISGVLLSEEDTQHISWLWKGQKQDTKCSKEWQTGRFLLPLLLLLMIMICFLCTSIMPVVQGAGTVEEATNCYKWGLSAVLCWDGCLDLDGGEAEDCGHPCLVFINLTPDRADRRARSRPVCPDLLTQLRFFWHFMPVCGKMFA